MRYAQRYRIGLAYTENVLSLVLIHRNRVVWWNAVSPWNAPLGDVMQSMLGQCPLQWRLSWRRPAVVAALGTPYARWKTVRGLPAITAQRTLQNIVATTPHRFFVGDPGELVTTTATVIEACAVQMGALSKPVVDDITHAIQVHGFKVLGITPADAIPKEDSLDSLPEVRVAYRVAQLPVSALSLYRPPPLRSPEKIRRRKWMLGGTAASIVLLAASLPMLAALRTRTSARHTIETLAPVRATVQRAQRELDQTAYTLQRISAFEQARNSHTWLLAELTDALPPQSAITSIKVDSTGVFLIAITPRASDLIKRLETIRGVAQVAVVGPVTPDQSGTTALERLTVRFQYAPQQADLRQPLALVEDIR